MRATGTVQAIDPVAREVTLKTEAGQLRTVHVGRNVTGVTWSGNERLGNLDQVKVGDVITVTYAAVAFRQPEVIQELGRDSPVAFPEARYGTYTSYGRYPSFAVTNGIQTIDPATGLISFVGRERDLRTVMVEDPRIRADLSTGSAADTLLYTDVVASSVELVPAQ